MSLNIIVAMTKERVIGNKEDLPWKISEDLKNFKQITVDNTVLMGRKTYFSFPIKYRPLPNRNNIVVTNNAEILQSEKVDSADSIESGIELARGYSRPIFIIGGATIYEQTLELVDNLYISHIKASFVGDTFFPNVDLDKWHINEEKDYDEFLFRIYQRTH